MGRDEFAGSEVEETRTKPLEPRNGNKEECLTGKNLNLGDEKETERGNKNQREKQSLMELGGRKWKMKGVMQ